MKLNEQEIKRLSRFKMGNVEGFSDSDNVAYCFDIPELKYVSVKSLKLLWKAGFGILGLDNNGNGFYTLWWYNKHLAGSSFITLDQFNFWASIIYQLQTKPELESAFTIESVSVNPYLSATLYSRSICCISSSRGGNSFEKNKKDLAKLYQQLKDLGYFPIALQGMFYEEGKESPDEKSFLVVSRKGEDENTFKQNMYKLGMQYNQDSILMRDKDEEEAYYLGTNETDTPTTFRPGLGKECKIGVLLPNKVSGYCSVPIKFGKLQQEDAFAFWTPYESPLPPKPTEDSDWELVEPNIYKKLPYFMWRVTKDGKEYKGITNNLMQARNLVKRIKAGNIPARLKM